MKIGNFVKAALVAAGAAIGLGGNAPRPVPSYLSQGAAATTSSKDIIAQRIRVPRVMDERLLLGIGAESGRIAWRWPFNGKNRSQRAGLQWAFRCQN